MSRLLFLALLSACGLFSGSGRDDDDDDDGDGGDDSGSSDGGSGDGGSGDGGSSDGGSSDGGSSQDSAAVFTGPVTAWPVVVEHPLFDPDQLPVVNVLWSQDGGQSFAGDWEYCHADYSFEVEAGLLRINETYCTGGATHYLVSVQEADEVHMGELRPEGATVESALARLDAPPLMSAWFQGEAGWYTTAVFCKGGTSTRLTEGALTINPTYCTPDSGAFQVALAAPASTLGGRVGEASATVDSGALRLDGPPVFHVWFDGAALGEEGSLYQLLQYCSGGYTFTLREGEVEVNQTYCTSAGQEFWVSLGE